VISPADRSYRALLAVRSLPRILLSMAVSRIAGAMLSVAIILFTLDEYHSPELAGLVTFVGIMPGLLVSPIAGALLDRHGRMRLVMFDYWVGAGSLVLIGLLAIAGELPPWLLVLIAAVSSLSSPLSNTGVRSLFPLIVPEHLWERVNAVDSNGYVAATLVGPPVAAAAVLLVGGPTTLIAIGVMFAIAAIVLIGAHEPETPSVSSGSLLRDAREGVVYALRNPTIRGLAASMSVLNISWGLLTIAIPVIVVSELRVSEAWVGVAWAVSGATGMVTAAVFGRMDSRGREKSWLVRSMLGVGLAIAILLVSHTLPALLLSMALNGLLNGPLDIAMFTVRQRRTDAAWFGRAFAVSASLNFAGYPIGAAVGGELIASSVELTIALGVAVCLVGAALAWWQIPREDAPSMNALAA
jgi:MFS family permease